MLEGLREDPETRDIQVILLTEEGGHEEVIRAWSAGADLCIPWSHGEADVLATLHRVLAPEPVAHHLAVCCECPA
jgi:DNA-binding NarL/FixJ family response regulator